MKAPPLVTLRIVWAAILVSVALLFVSLRFVSLPSEPADPSLFPILLAVGLVQSVGSIVLPGFLHRQGTRAQPLETREVARTVTPDSPSPTLRVFVDPDKARLEAQKRFQVVTILSLALSESVALFGYVLGFQGHPEGRVVPFFLVSLVLILIRFPRAGAAERMLETSTGASFPEAAGPSAPL